MQPIRSFRQLQLYAYVLLFAGIPTAIVAILFREVETQSVGQWTLIFLVVPLWLFSYVMVAGSISRIALKGMVPGLYPRDLTHSVYGPRRLHAICWTSIYYFTPLYHLLLALPLLKRLLFRLFGYRGSLDFTIYPDAWVRDLPLLSIGPGAYIANRATLGTNICLRSGEILVDRITIGARTYVGHLAVIGPGNKIGEDAEIGVGTTLGINVRIGNRTVVGAIAGLNHGCTIGANCRIDSMVYIGQKARIADKIHIHYGSVVPDRANILSQEQANLCRPAQSSISALCMHETRPSYGIDSHTEQLGQPEGIAVKDEA